MAAAVENLRASTAPVPPSKPRYITNDPTVEKLGDILSKNPKGVAVWRDEAMGLLHSWDREGHESDRAFYLEAHNGTGSYNIDRIGRGSLHVPSLCLSIVGGTQPELFEKYLSAMQGSLDNDGRVQRFIMIYPEPVAWEWRDRYPVAGAREEVWRTFKRLADFDPVEAGARLATPFVRSASRTSTARPTITPATPADTACFAGRWLRQ